MCQHFFEKKLIYKRVSLIFFRFLLFSLVFLNMIFEIFSKKQGCSVARTAFSMFIYSTEKEDYFLVVWLIQVSI